MKTKPKGKLMWQDILLVVGIMFNIGARLATGFIENSISTLVTTANVLEANPAQRALTTQSYYVQFIASVVMYALLITYYFWMRSQRNKSEYSRYAFNFVTILVFWGFMLDFISDFGIVLSIIFK